MGLMDYGMDGWGNTGGMDDEPYRPGLLGSIKNWAAQDKNKFALAQALAAMGQPAQGKNSTASTLGTIANMLGAYNQANLGGYDAYKQQADMKKMQLDEMAAQAEQRKAQTQALQAKAAQDQRAQGIVGGLTKQWASPNMGMSNGPTTPEYAANASAFKSQPPMNPADRYAAIASALEEQGMLDPALKYREEGRKLAPQVEKIDTVMVGGVPRQVSYFKDGTYKIIDGIAPTPKVRYENIGGQILPIDEYTQQFGKPINRTQSPDSIASNQVTMRGQNITDNRAREFNQIAREGNVVKTETDLRKEFADLPEVKKYKQAFPAFDAVRQAVTRNNPQSDINLIYGMAKLYDPDSVVREGEYATIANSQSIPEWLKGHAQRLAGGGRLTPETKKQLLGEAESRIGTYESQFNAAQEAYGKIGAARGASAQNLFTPVGRAADKQAGATYSDPDKEARYQAWKRSQGM